MGNFLFSNALSMDVVYVVWNGIIGSMSWTPARDKVEGEEEEITLFFC